MKKLIETLRSLGIEIPADKETEIKSELSKNYKNVAEVTKTTEKLETERDSWKERAETAETTLKGFEGKDFDTITRERDEWKRKAEEAEQNFNAREAAREKQELLKEAFADIEFTSNAAKNAIMAQVSESVTVRNGKLMGLSDILEDIKKNDASAFVDKQQESLEQGKAKFTQPLNRGKASGATTLTKKDIMTIKDPAERQAKIAENIELFRKG